MAETTMQGSLYKYDEYYHSYCMSNSESSVAFEVAIFISCSCLSCSSTICIYQCKNFGVTSTLSRLHQYDEGMLPTRFLGSSLRCFLLYQKTYLTTFQAFQSPTKQQRNSIIGRWVRLKRTRNLTRNDGLYI